LSYNVKKRIDSAVTIFDYIIKNFNEEIYASKIKWDEFQNRIQLKNYVIAQFYYDQINNHVNNNAIPEYVKCSVTKEELVKYCSVFAKEGMKYIDDGLNQGPTFLNELLKLKELYYKYNEEVKAEE
ncbi:MAG: hypothetical protein ACI8WT_005136, partial [Clostridium sp.]